MTVDGIHPVSPLLRERLRASSLLSPLGEAEYAAVEAELEWVRLEAGEALFRAGDPGDSLYVLVHGRLLVTVGGGGQPERVINEIKPGESVGELAVLSDEPRSAGVRAIRDALLVRLSRERFLRLVETTPRAVLSVNRVIIERLKRRSSDAAPGSSVSVIAVVGADRDAPAARFATALAAALAPVGLASTVRHLTARAVREALGERARAEEEVLGWLNTEEQRHRFLVLEADPEDLAWTRRCIRQADAVLVVARPGAPPDVPAAIFEALLQNPRPGGGSRAELVLVHPDGPADPRGTRRWLDALPVRRHHHLRLGAPADLARLVRSLTGQAIAVVLGGGAVRGAAHIGVLRALEEARVPVDFLCGTSMGAILAAQAAFGLGSANLHARARPLFLGESVFDFTVPLLSFTSGGRFDRLLQGLFGDREIEDLWLPFFCVSSNLSRAEEVVHERGPIWRAVRASSSLPGIFPPVVEPSGDLLVDGALLNNLPVERAREKVGGRIVAVNVIPAVERSIHAAPAGRLSALQLVMGKLKGLPAASPTIVDVILRSVFLGTVSEADRVRPLVDLYLEPPVSEYGFLDGKPFDAIVEAGYAHARPRIEEWRAADPGITAG